MPETLAAHIKVLSGWAFPSDGFNELDGLPLIRIRDLGSGTTEVKFKGSYDPRYVIDDGDVLIGMDGDFSVEKWAGGPALLNQRVCKVESTSENLDQGFLYWYLMPHVAEIHRKTPQTTVRHLAASSLGRIVAPSISVVEQRTVNEVLDTLDTTIRQTEAIIAKLKQVKQGLLHDLLTRGIDANGELRPPRSQAPHLYKDSPLGWIPSEWNTQAVSALTRVTVGHVGPIEEHFEDSNDGIALLSTTSIGDDGRLQGEHRKVTRAFDRSHLNSHLRPGDLIVARHGKSGSTAVVPDCLEAAQSLNVVIVRSSASFLSPFLAAWLNHPRTRQKLLGGQAGSVQPIVGTRGVASLVVAVPSVLEQQLICARQSASLGRLDAEAKFADSLRSLRVGIMDDLLTGRVRVTPLLDAARP